MVRLVTGSTCILSEVPFNFLSLFSFVPRAHVSSMLLRWRFGAALLQLQSPALLVIRALGLCPAPPRVQQASGRSTFLVAKHPVTIIPTCAACTGARIKFCLGAFDADLDISTPVHVGQRTSRLPAGRSSHIHYRMKCR